MKSIVSNDRQCWVCGTPLDLHRHHVYGGACRNLSETYGCWVYLCARHHNMSNEGVHFNKGLDLLLKKHTQRIWEETYGDREAFRKVFSRSYL